jgi:hypothetical protein
MYNIIYERGSHYLFARSFLRICSTPADPKFSAKVQIFPEKVHVSNAPARKKK